MLCEDRCRQAFLSHVTWPLQSFPIHTSSLPSLTFSVYIFRVFSYTFLFACSRCTRLPELTGHTVTMVAGTVVYFSSFYLITAVRRTPALDLLSTVSRLIWATKTLAAHPHGLVFARSSWANRNQHCVQVCYICVRAIGLLSLYDLRLVAVGDFFYRLVSTIVKSTLYNTHGDKYRPQLSNR